MEHILSYTLVRSKKRKKTVTLQVKKDGSIIIHAPYHTPRTEIDGFFKGRSLWIRKKLLEREKLMDKAERPERFVSGEEFLYLGESYPLEICHKDGINGHLLLSQGVFHLAEDKVERARECFIGWYRQRAQEVIPERVAYWSKQYRLFPEEVRITTAWYRYGSCSPIDRLSFSWRIIMAPLRIMDYVIIHELAHIREKNHSTRFWDYLAKMLPDYQTHKTWLRQNGHSLRI